MCGAARHDRAWAREGNGCKEIDYRGCVCTQVPHRELVLQRSLQDEEGVRARERRERREWLLII